MALRPIISYLLFGLDLLAGRQTSSNGREARLLAHVHATVPPGQPDALLAAIDTYHHTTEWFMNVGDGKGRVLTDALARLSPPPKAVLVSWHQHAAECCAATSLAAAVQQSSKIARSKGGSPRGELPCA